MEYLIYSLMDSAYAEATVEDEFSLPEFKLTLDWKKLFKSTWLTYATATALFAILAQSQVVSAAYSGPGRYYVSTNGSCLNIRTGPSTYYSRVACYRNGSRLPNVRGYTRGFARLSTGYYASTRWINRRPGSGHTPGLGVGGRVLSLGSQGSAVRRVQRILGITPTGYYGTATARAVRNFQQNNSIYPVDGRVGPETRRALNQYANTGYTPNYDDDYLYRNRDRYDTTYLYSSPDRYYDDSLYRNRDRYDTDYLYSSPDRYYDDDYLYRNRDRNNDYYSYNSDYSTGGRDVLSRGSRGSAVREIQRYLGVRVTGNYNRATERAVRNFQAKNGLPVTGVVDSNTRMFLGL
ncbi:peptidoglycan-binding protein [Scytonema hofmannii]|uniref:peptidoglycan-binding protein n=1 Tax=Scytonema hofmannii TaxID=34078 RepID=UPI00034BD412|nr:peptidoglycan-binding protein [Scytonema hofmannii]